MTKILFSLSDVYNHEKIQLTSTDNEEAIIGGIILNRIVGIAYYNMDMSSINKESRKCLTILKKYYEKQYDSFIKRLQFITTILKEVDFQYAFLKGAFLIPALYTRGQRISNDIDILINADDVCKIQHILMENEFVQGHCDENGNIVPATRREIIEAKMNYGETVPFLRCFNNEIFEVDLNFSMDYKAQGSKDIVDEMLQDAEVYVSDLVCVQTLSKPDFLIHLCCHLFKEATTYDWLVNRRDLMLYKFSDINVFINTYGNVLFFEDLVKKIESYHVEKACYYTFFNASKIYPRLMLVAGFEEMLERIRPISIEFLKEIVSPKERRSYMYDLDFADWFDCTNRISMLHEKNNI